jgi:hypothetical protein
MSDTLFKIENSFCEANSPNDENILNYLWKQDIMSNNLNLNQYNNFLFSGDYSYQEMERKYSDNTLESSGKPKDIYTANQIETISDYDSIRDRSNTISYKKQRIFRIRKVFSKKTTYNEKYDKRLLRQLRNRIAAKKFRENKKYEYDDLMKKIKDMEEELSRYKRLYEMNKVIVY